MLSSHGEKSIWCVFDRHGRAIATVITDDFGYWRVEREDLSTPLHVVELSGIVIDPCYQGKGIGKTLYQSVVKQHPDIIIGISKNPIAVKTREKALREFGYVTYAGRRKALDDELVSDREFSLLTQVIEQYCRVAQVGTCREDLVIETEPNFIPELVGASVTDQASVQVLHHLQERFGDVADFLLPVVSVKEKLLIRIQG